MHTCRWSIIQLAPSSGVQKHTIPKRAAARESYCNNISSQVIVPLVYCNLLHNRSIALVQKGSFPHIAMTTDITPYQHKVPRFKDTLFPTLQT